MLSMLSEFFCARSDRCVFLGAWSGLALVFSHAAVHGWIKYALNKWYVSYFPATNRQSRPGLCP